MLVVSQRTEVVVAFEEVDFWEDWRAAFEMPRLSDLKSAACRRSICHVRFGGATLLRTAVAHQAVSSKRCRNGDRMDGSGRGHPGRPDRGHRRVGSRRQAGPQC